MGRRGGTSAARRQHRGRRRDACATPVLIRCSARPGRPRGAPMDFQPSARSEEYLRRVKDFVRDHIAPVERAIWEGAVAQGHAGDWTRWRVDPRVEELKSRARAPGLWNLFLPDPSAGAGLSTLEYAPIAEETGRSLLAPEVFNCAAPDTGNMEVLWT